LFIVEALFSKSFFETIVNKKAKLQKNSKKLKIIKTKTIKHYKKQKSPNTLFADDRRSKK